MNDHTLLPCPFCGGEAHLFDGYWVECTKCGCQTPETFEEVAISAWNRRTPPAAVPDGWLEAMKLAEKALHPFYAAVFNDNGDMTVSGGYPYHEAIAGYHAYKRVRAMISAAPAAPTEASDE